MANTKEIALVQVRRSESTQLPLALEEGEFGLALDTAQVFIGCSEYEPLKERYKNRIFPYGNLQLLTEFSDNLNIIEHHYIGNCAIPAQFPIIATSTDNVSTLHVGDKLSINNVEITITSENVEELPTTINATHIPGVSSYLNGTKFVVATTGSSLVLANVAGTPLIDMGYGSEPSYSYSATDTAYRKLQAVLDDYVSAKAYGVMGNGVDDTFNINAMLLNIYTTGNTVDYRRSIFFPAGQYNINSNGIYLPSYTHLKGEGIQRTIFNKTADSRPLLGTMDSNGVPNSSNGFGIDTTEGPHDILIEDITFMISSPLISTMIVLTGASNVYFKNCEFIGVGNVAENKLVTIPNYTGDAINSIKNITFECCRFRNATYGLYITNKVANLRIIDCRFDGMEKSAIHLDGNENQAPVGALVEGCTFTKCGKINATPIIKYGANTVFCGLLHSVWGCDISNDEWNDGVVREIIKYELDSETAYTDTFDKDTDPNMFLRFGYPQAYYDYVDRLTDYTGAQLVTPIYDADGNDNPLPTKNPIMVKPSSESNETTIIYTENGDLDIISNNGDLRLSGKEKVVIPSTLDIAGGQIVNSDAFVRGYTFTLSNDGVVLVSDDATCTSSYAERIEQNSNALTNVDYVKKVAYDRIGTFVINKQIKFTESSWRYYRGVLNIGNIDVDTYGDYAYIRNIIVQVEDPITIDDPLWSTDMKSMGIYAGTYSNHKEDAPITDIVLVGPNENDIRDNPLIAPKQSYVYEINTPSINVSGKDLFVVFYNDAGEIAQNPYKSGTINILIYINTIPQTVANNAEQEINRTLVYELDTSWFIDPVDGAVFSTIPNEGDNTWHDTHGGTGNYITHLSGDIGIALKETYTPRGALSPVTIIRDPTIIMADGTVYQDAYIKILSPTSFGIQNASGTQLKAGSKITMTVNSRLVETW